VVEAPEPTLKRRRERGMCEKGWVWDEIAPNAKQEKVKLSEARGAKFLRVKTRHGDISKTQEQRGSKTKETPTTRA